MKKACRKAYASTATSASSLSDSVPYEKPTPAGWSSQTTVALLFQPLFGGLVRVARRTVMVLDDEWIRGKPSRAATRRVVARAGVVGLPTH